MSRIVFSVFATLALLATSLVAADLTGKWTAETEGRDGQKRTVILNLKSEGEALSGTVSGPGGRDFNIENGKITGDDVSFAVTMEFNGNSRRVEYKGKLVGDQLNLKSGQGERTRELTAKRATS